MSTQSTDVISNNMLVGSPLSHAARLFGPNAVARITARRRSDVLDRALAAGADPAASPPIAARTAQLGSTSTRRRIADGLERLALSADKQRSPLQIMPSPAAMLGNRPQMLELANILRQDRPLYASGIAMLKVTLTDCTGPAYTDQRGDVLARQLQVARAELTS